MAEKKDFPVFRVGIVTLSDKGYQGEREDKSGPKIKELLPAEQYRSFRCAFCRMSGR